MSKKEYVDFVFKARMGYITPAHICVPMVQGCIHARMYYLKVLLENDTQICWNFVFQRDCTFHLRRGDVTLICGDLLGGCIILCPLEVQ